MPRPPRPVGQPEAEGDATQADDERDRDAFGQESGAERGRGNRTQSQEHGHLGRRRVLERPEPEVVAEAAARADERDGEPAASGEAGQGGEEPLPGGEGGQERDRGGHGEGADLKRRIGAQKGPIEHGADGPDRGTGEDRDLADPAFLRRTGQ